jgi:hypothetical protein
MGEVAARNILMLVEAREAKETGAEGAVEGDEVYVENEVQLEAYKPTPPAIKLTLGLVSAVGCCHSA